MGTDSFVGYPDQLDSPVTNAFAVTPADSELTNWTRAVWVGGAGNLTVILADDSSAVEIEDIPAGSLLPIRCKQIRAATTATKIVGFY